MRRAARARRAAARPHKAAAIAQNTAAAASHGWVNMVKTLLEPCPNQRISVGRLSPLALSWPGAGPGRPAGSDPGRNARGCVRSR